MGKAGSGKDTIGFLLGDLLKRKGYSNKRYAFADGVKDMAAALTGVARYRFDYQDFKKDYFFSLTDGRTYHVDSKPIGHDLITIRQLLQKLGTDVMQRIFGKNVWVNKVFSEIQNESKYCKVGIITDVRFKHEYEAIKNAGGIIIRINNPYIKPTDNHISEVDLDNYEADYVFTNNWMDDPDNVDKQSYELSQQIINGFRHNQVLQNSTERA